MGKLRIQTKLFVAIAVNIVFFIGIILFVIKPYFIERSIEQDEQVTRNQIESVSEVFANQRNTLERILMDWAVWNDSYRFVQDENESFITNNLGDESLQNLNVGAMIFLNESNRVAYASYPGFYELSTEAETTQLTNTILRLMNQQERPRHGIYGTDYGPVLLVSHPIVKSDGTGPSTGTLVFLQKIGPDFLAAMSAQAKVNLSISPLSHERLNIEQDEQFDRVSMPLQAIYDDANWELNFSVKRMYYANTQSVLETGIVGLVALGAILLLTIYGTIHQLITKRLFEIIDELKEITRQRNSRLRIKLRPGKRDEIEEMAIRMNDVLEALEKTQQESMDRAFRDSLTRLPNRLAVEDLLIHVEPSVTHLGVMGIDLDNFRRVNDQYGQRAGDAMLVYFASRLNFYKEDGFAARIGADEFIVVHPTWTIEELTLVAQQLIKDLREWGQKQGMTQLTMSVGIDELTASLHTYEAMMARLDVVLHEVKLSGKNKILSYESIENGSHYLHALEMERDLRTALEEGQFELHYQPIVAPRPFRVRGIEALIRWRHPKKGYISPGLFIPIAEQLGLISEIGRFVFRQALRETTSLLDQHDLFLSVNVSKRQVLDGSFLEVLDEALGETSFRPARLHVEITESEVGGNVYELQQFIQTLKAYGVCVSLDDFGVGTSSLSYLQALQIDVIKIDQNFVKGIPEQTFDRALLEGLYQTFHTLGLEIVTEGVERPEQLAFVLEHSDSLIQGYHFSKPIPLNDLQRYLYEAIAAADA